MAFGQNTRKETGQGGDTAIQGSDFTETVKQSDAVKIKRFVLGLAVILTF